MKIRIANVLNGAARTLLAAGTLGVPAAALAQTTPSVEQGLALKATAGSHGSDEAKRAQTAKYPRVIEMKVELAWLADPLTSSCRLEARTGGDALQVHGQAPNAALLEHPLQLAYDE